MPKAKPPRARATPNGAGWGGPANGAGWGGPASGTPAKPFSAEHQPDPAKLSAGLAKAKTAHEAAKPHAAKMVDIWLEVANDPTAPPMARLVAAEKIVERAEGKATQSHDVRTHGDAARSGDAALLAVALAGSRNASAAETDQNEPDGVVH